MPYIKQEDRDAILSGVKTKLDSAGEVNYVFTVIIQEYINNHGLSYKTLNELVGVLECAKLELYRRVAAPYEEQKIKDNGDVYE